MDVDDSPHKHGVPFAGEYLKRYEANIRRVTEIKEWRTTELQAGRPSSLADYCRAHGLCAHCHGTGLALNKNGMGFKAVGWNGETQLFEECEACGGSGQGAAKSQHEVRYK
jgi:DnaJ-class molecular chaperone